LAVNATLFVFLYLCQFSKDYKGGLKLEVTTNLPIGAGLGSSGSFSSVLVTSLFCLLNLFEEESKFIENLSNLENSNLKYSTSEKELEVLNKWAYLIETIFHGTPSGIDNTVSTFGGSIIYSKGSFTKFNNIPNNLQILVINTKVERSTKEIVQKVRQNKEKNEKEVIEKMEKIQECTDNCLKLFNDYDDKNWK